MWNSPQRNITVLEICNLKCKVLRFLPLAPTPWFRQNFVPALVFLQMVCVSYLCSHGSTRKQNVTYLTLRSQCQGANFAIWTLFSDSTSLLCLGLHWIYFAQKIAINNWIIQNQLSFKPILLALPFTIIIKLWKGIIINVNKQYDCVELIKSLYCTSLVLFLFYIYYFVSQVQAYVLDQSQNERQACHYFLSHCLSLSAFDLHFALSLSQVWSWTIELKATTVLR